MRVPTLSSLFSFSPHSSFIVLTLSLLVCAPTALAIDVQPFSREYKSNFAGFRAKSMRSLTEVSDGIYELKVNAKNLFARYEEGSRFRLNELGQPVPLENWTHINGLGIVRKERTLFDWEAGIATWTKKKDVREVEIEPGMVDRLLYQLMLPDALESQVQNPSFQFVHRGRIREYVFEVFELETIDIAKQQVEAIPLRRITDHPTKQTDIWLAPESYELLKIAHRDKDGSAYGMELKRL